ncbi:MAG TPA: bifunctional nuclease domain-containing protein [Ktedonobacteraceae bacterium]|jgi:RNA polymerase sigma factor (sigma-70 family)|nr:bifunctional nuclease domain-containing protein [Ktedonobacteraceae bacterium]
MKGILITEGDQGDGKPGFTSRSDELVSTIVDERSDAELVILARAGDKHAFGQLISRYQPMAERIAMGMVANAFVAQELAQEAILQAYLSLDRLRDSERFRSWLYGITLNVCRGYLRDQKIDFYSLEALMGGMSIDAPTFSGALLDPQTVAEERELHHTLLRAVHALSPRERAATLLFYYEQLSLREVAAMLEISVVAVKGRLYKARKQLKEYLLALPDWEQEDSSLRQRRRTMIKVTVVEAVSFLKPETKERGNSVVVLLDEAGQRAMGIWIGPAEAAAIEMGLNTLQWPRPMTMNFMASVLKAAGAALEEARIETLKDEIFYAVAKIRSGDTVNEIDARPSDAIALAVVTGSPVYVAEEILEKCGVALPEGKTLHRIEPGVTASLAEDQPLEVQRETIDLTWPKMTREEYDRQFQRVLGILTR